MTSWIIQSCQTLSDKPGTRITAKRLIDGKQVGASVTIEGRNIQKSRIEAIKRQIDKDLDAYAHRNP